MGNSVSDTSNASTAVEAEGPYFGEYKCSGCGRFWHSRLCWRNSYQKCKRCLKPVYAHNLRPIISSDQINEDYKDHEMALCQRCQELGIYCGRRREVVSTEPSGCIII